MVNTWPYTTLNVAPTRAALRYANRAISPLTLSLQTLTVAGKPSHRVY